jgi:hypothetical protein
MKIAVASVENCRCYEQVYSNVFSRGSWCIAPIKYGEVPFSIKKAQTYYLTASHPIRCLYGTKTALHLE